MTTKPSATYFAPAERAPEEVIERERRDMTAAPFVATLLDSFPEPAALLNGQRQIIRANDKLQRLLSRSDHELSGLRMGEALGCQHANEEPAGCGTTRACAVCGAARAIDIALADRERATEDCRLTVGAPNGHAAVDLRVWTTPLTIGDGSFAVFAVRDTSDEHRRTVLERMFFHDVLNAAGGLREILKIWPELNEGETAELSSRVAPLAAQIVEEIEAHRDMSAAERGDLVVATQPVQLTPLLAELAELYRGHPVAAGKTLRVVTPDDTACATSDVVLVRRIVGNLIKNALEASRAGQTVTVGHEVGERPRITVHNDGVMPESVQLQVFQRSFSTKARHGRGVGTYGSRLLAEHYLEGRLTFTSTSEGGTTFILELPACPAESSTA